MKINNNIIAKDLDSPLQLIEIDIEDSYITGKVLVGSGSYVKGKVYKMPYINFQLVMPNDESIKIGTKLVAKKNYAGSITVNNIYEIFETTIRRFAIKNDNNDEHYFSINMLNDFFYIIKPDKKKKDPIVKQVTDKFKQRSKVGIEKYGTTLAENNTDDFLEHLQQELMDATLYIQKLKEQNKQEKLELFDGLKNKILKDLTDDELHNEITNRGYKGIVYQL